jgi:hypothetical protein
MPFGKGGVHGKQSKAAVLKGATKKQRKDLIAAAKAGKASAVAAELAEANALRLAAELAANEESTSSSTLPSTSPSDENSYKAAVLRGATKQQRQDLIAAAKARKASAVDRLLNSPLTKNRPRLRPYLRPRPRTRIVTVASLRWEAKRGSASGGSARRSPRLRPRHRPRMRVLAVAALRRTCRRESVSGGSARRSPRPRTRVVAVTTLRRAAKRGSARRS